MSYCKPKTWAEIDISALLNNYRFLKKRACGAEPICVVKADCYGHGTEGVVPELVSAGCTYFAVSCLPEALDVRKYTDGEILILGYTPPCDVGYVIEKGITQAVFSPEYANAVCGYIPNGKKLKVHVKLDTGMNRIGYCRDDMEQALQDCKRTQFDIKGIFTHLATADESSLSDAQKQLALFSEMKKYLNGHGVETGISHTSNSAAILRMKESIFDAVRLGICLYGCEPSECVCTDGLLPAMSLKTTVAHIHTLKKGCAVSYGGEYIANTDRQIATLAAGYADGFVRACRGGKVGINGCMFDIVGRICMDQLMVDITDHADKVSCGDTAVLFGVGGMHADEQARLAGTIGYELLSQVNKRVPRIYVK